MKLFLLGALLSIFIFGESLPTRTEMEAKGWVTERDYNKKIVSGEITITNRQLQEMLASGELTTTWDENSTKVKTTNALAKLEAKIWLVDDNTKKTIDSMNNNMKILWARIQQLESMGCECEVRCRSKSARDMIEDIEYLVDDVESRVSDLETKVEEIE